MPLQLARAVHWVQRHCHEVTEIKCLPTRKSSKVGTNEDVVKSLAGDVNLLCAQIENADLAEVKKAKGEEVIQKVSVDVQKQLHTVLEVISSITAERGERPACQKHAQEEAIELLENFIALDLPVQLLMDLPLLQFEARKAVMNINCALLWPGIPQQLSTQVLQYIQHHPHVFSILVKGYGNDEVALQCGVVLRSYARRPELAEAFLKTRLIFDLIEHTKNPSFDISSDALYTLKEVLLENKDVSSHWLEDHYQEFFTHYNGLLSTENYLLQRPAVTLMANMFLDRHFKKAMLAYVSDEKNLKIFMNLLLTPSKVLKYDAFQVFKVFAANPQKPRRVHLILYKNKAGLVKLLEGIQAPRADDDRFSGDQRTVIERLVALGPPSPATEASL